MQLTQNEALTKAIEYHKIGNKDEANRYYLSILNVDPTHADANHNLGLLHLNNGNFNMAYEHLKVALENNLEIPQFWLSFIDILIKLNLISDAKLFFEQAKEKGYTELSIGFKALEEKLYVDTECRKYNLIPNKINEPSKDQLDLIFKLFKQNEFETIIGIVDQLLEEFPKSATLHHALGATNTKLKKFKKAIKNFLNALKFNSNDSIIHIDIANAYKEIDQKKDALKHFKKAIKINPKCHFANSNIADFYKYIGKLDLAKNHYKKAIK